jgi:prepilin-type N-terminal cleavage/methylation domain-containing protein
MRARARAGLTLIEVVVAMSIASIVAVTGYGAFAALSDQALRVTRAAPDARTANMRRVIADWLRSAMLIPGVDAASFRGIDDPLGEYPSDVIVFLTSAQTPLGTQPTLVRIYVDADSLTSERGLVATLEEWGGEQSQTLVLDSLVAGLDVRYRSSLLSEQRWLPSWVSTTVLPDAAQLYFAMFPVDPRSAIPDPLNSRPLTIAVGPVR